MRLSGIANWRQPRSGDCLPACAAMVLAHLNHPLDYERLRRQLGTTETGTLFSHLGRLRSWRLSVEVGQGTFETLHQQLAAGHPVIAAVATEFLPYWLTRPDVEEADRLTEHAVVVVGLDEQTVVVNDPDFDAAPQVVARGWFADAWQAQNNRYAVLRPRWPWRLWQH